MSHAADIDPSTLSPRRRRSRERKEARILDAALALLEREGVDGLTMQKLAKDLDYAPAALYRYFRSKDAMLAAIQGRAIRELEQAFDDAREAWTASLPEAPRPRALAELLGAAAFYITLRERHARIAAIVGYSINDTRQLVDNSAAADVAQPMVQMLTRVGRLFAAAVEAGALRDGDPLERCVALWGSVHGVMLLSKLERLAPAAIAAQPVARLTARTLLSGWGADPADLALASQWLEGAFPTQGAFPKRSLES